MGGDIYPGVLLLAVLDLTPDVALCDMDRCDGKAVVMRGNHRVCLDHGLLMPRAEGGEA